MEDKNEILKIKIELEELKHKALSLDLCPKCGEKLNIFKRHIKKDPKKTDTYKVSDGYDGWYFTKECTKDKTHYFIEIYDQFDDEE